jgi:hypothetical protein
MGINDQEMDSLKELLKYNIPTLMVEVKPELQKSSASSSSSELGYINSLRNFMLETSDLEKTFNSFG